MNPVVAVTTWKRYTKTFLGEKTPNYTLIDDYAEAFEKAGRDHAAHRPCR